MANRTSQLKQKEECSIVIVEATGSLRQMIGDTLKEVGFQKITGVSTPKDVLHILEVDHVDWIITSLAAAETVNALHVLKTITLHPQLRNTHTTLLWESSGDEDVIPYAFELGLLSLHQKSYLRDGFVSIFTQLLEIFQQYNWDGTLVAAEYLRQHLAKTGQHKERLHFEETMLTLYPGSAQILLNLADAELAIDKKNGKGSTILDQLELIDEKMVSQCKRLRQQHGIDKYTDKDQTEIGPGTLKNIFDIRTAVIVDPDTDVLFHATDLLTRVGVENIQSFESGTQAYEWLSATKLEPDIIIMEWKIPGITGAILAQRIRSLGFHQVPLVVISSLIKSSDGPILREMGIDDCQEKPVDQASFYNVIIRVIQQSRCPTEEKSSLQKIKRLLRANKLQEAESFMSQLFQNSKTSEANRKEIEAEYYMAKNDLVKARDAGIASIKLGGNSLNMLNLIGKAMLKLRQFDGALKCFERANSISSLNVERLLDIAEACIETDALGDASQAVAQAKALDISNPSVTQMECKIHIVAGKSELAKNLMGDLESGKNIISYMNNRAVSLAKSGRFDDAIELYSRTLNSIPSTWNDQQAAVIYNTALAFARYGHLDKAASVLQEIVAIDSSNSLISKRAMSLNTRIKQCLATKTNLVLSSSDEGSVGLPDAVPAGDEDPFEKIGAKLELQIGDIGCHLIFFNLERPVCKLLDNLPLFKPRQAFDAKRKIPVVKRKEA